jgi:IPT/TIG domain
MKKETVFMLLVSAAVAVFQSCQLKRVDPPCPSIASLIPAAAGFGDTVAIKGTNFLAGLPSLYTVHVGNKTVPAIDVPDEGTIRFRVPVGLGDGPVSVSVGGVGCNNASSVNFIYHIKVTDIQLFTNSGGFNNPSGMVVDGYGNLIVADKGNHGYARNSRKWSGIICKF